MEIIYNTFQLNFVKNFKTSFKSYVTFQLNFVKKRRRSFISLDFHNMKTSNIKCKNRQIVKVSYYLMSLLTQLPYFQSYNKILTG